MFSTVKMFVVVAMVNNEFAGAVVVAIMMCPLSSTVNIGLVVAMVSRAFVAAAVPVAIRKPPPEPTRNLVEDLL